MSNRLLDCIILGSKSICIVIVGCSHLNVINGLGIVITLIHYMTEDTKFKVRK